MFQKLIKYEWKAYSKSILFILLAAIGITLLGVVSIIMFNPEGFSQSDWLTFVNISTYASIFLVYYFGIIAISLAASLIIAVRYYKTMYTDQGYLTHTLPVTRAQLFWSKFLAAFGYQLFTFIMIALSIAALVSVFLIRLSSIEDFMEDFIRFLTEIIEDIGVASTIGYVIFYTFFLLISCISNILMIYASITLGQLFVKHRIIGSIIAYFVITVIMQVINLALNFICSFVSTVLFDFEMMSFSYYNTYYFVISAIYAVLCVVLTIITLSQLKNNLNLE